MTAITAVYVISLTAENLAKSTFDTVDSLSRQITINQQVTTHIDFSLERVLANDLTIYDKSDIVVKLVAIVDEFSKI